MTEQTVDERLLRADRWSKVIALGVSVVAVFASIRLTTNLQFSMIVAAFVGIGVRIYVPYHASISMSGPDRKPIQRYEAAADYHQGAVGAALVLAAVAAMLVESASGQALAVGAGVALAAFLVLRRVLPS